MSSHHPNGPSTLLRRRACPGSFAAEAAVAQQPEADDADAAAGTLRHEAAADGLRDRRRRAECLARLPAEDAELVNLWWSWWDKQVDSANTNVAVGIPVLGGVEDRVALPGGRFGSVDCWLSYVDAEGQNVLIVADLKGQPPGRAGSNLQLADYVRGIISRFHEGTRFAITVALISRAGVDQTLYDEGQHAKLCAEIDAIVAATQQPDAPRRPSPHCAHCRAAATCHARQAVAAEAAAMIPTMADAVATMRDLSPTARTDLLDRLCVAVDRLTEAKDVIKEAIRSGAIEVPGYRAQATTHAAWRNADEAREAVTALAAASAANVNELFPLVAPSKAAQILGKNAVENLIERRPATIQVRRVKESA